MHAIFVENKEKTHDNTDASTFYNTPHQDQVTFGLQEHPLCEKLCLQERPEIAPPLCANSVMSSKIKNFKW